MNGFRKTLVRNTKATGSIVDGIYTDGAQTPTNITASVQPIKPSDVQHLPEGRRNSKSFWLFTDTELNMITASNPDLITIDGEQFEVVKKEAWQNGVINHYKFLVVKVLEA